MKSSCALLLALLAGIAGCGGGGPAVSQGTTALPPALRSDRQTAANPAASDRGTAAPDQRALSLPVPPAGAQYTIYCQTISGPDHVARANRSKVQLLAQTPLKDWYVIHQDGQSTLNYGFYRSFNDPKDADSKRAQRDRKAIDVLADQQGVRPFRFAFFVAMDSPDPGAPAEWNLVNADGAYSLQIAAYTGSIERKRAAIDAVRAAQAQGHEAYYYHGETTSSVCVGAWPETAIRRKQLVTNSDGDPDQSFFRSTEPLPPELADNLRDSQNKRVRVEQERPEVRDPTLLDMMKQFPQHAVNGEVPIVNLSDPRTGAKIAKPAESFVVPIPRAQPSLLTGGTVAGDKPAPESLVKPRDEQGVGKLKSIGP